MQKYFLRFLFNFMTCSNIVFRILAICKETSYLLFFFLAKNYFSLNKIVFMKKVENQRMPYTNDPNLTRLDWLKMFGSTIN
jgi:hypothetical protein